MQIVSGFHFSAEIFFAIQNVKKAKTNLMAQEKQSAYSSELPVLHGIDVGRKLEILPPMESNPHHSDQQDFQSPNAHIRVWDHKLPAEEVRQYLLQELGPLFRALHVDPETLKVYPAVISSGSEARQSIECKFDDRICTPPFELYSRLLRSTKQETIHAISMEIAELLYEQLDIDSQEGVMPYMPQVTSAFDALRCWQGVETARGMAWFPRKEFQLEQLHTLASQEPRAQREKLFSLGCNPRNTKTIQMTPFTPTHSYEWFQQAEKLAEYLETERRGSANIVAWVDPDDPWKLHYNIGSKQPHTPDEEKEDVILAEIAPEHEQRDQNNQTDEQNNAASEQAEKGMQSALEEMMEEKGIDLSRIAVIPGKSSPNTEGTTKHSRDFLCEYPVPTGATELQMTCAEAQHLLDEGAQKVFVCLRAVVGNRGVSIYLYRGKNAAAS